MEKKKKNDIPYIQVPSTFFDLALPTLLNTLFASPLKPPTDRDRVLVNDVASIFSISIFAYGFKGIRMMAARHEIRPQT